MVTLPNKAIARQLGVSQRTVCGHLYRIGLRLGTGSRVAALMIALRRGEIRLDEVHPGDAREAGEVW